ncbi:hypothetical protein ACN6MT_03125 [Neobacillus niacini]
MDKKGILNLSFAALSAVGIIGFVTTLDDKTIENLKKLKNL